MTQFELIDDYLANRLTEKEKNAFEQQLDGDPALKSEVEFQQQVVKGVQQARIAELKTMMNSIPVSSAGWSTGQITTAAVTVAIVTAGLYFYMQDDVTPPTLPDAVTSEIAALDAMLEALRKRLATLKSAKASEGSEAVLATQLSQASADLATAEASRTQIAAGVKNLATGTPTVDALTAAVAALKTSLASLGDLLTQAEALVTTD